MLSLLLMCLCAVSVQCASVGKKYPSGDQIRSNKFPSEDQTRRYDRHGQYLPPGACRRYDIECNGGLCTGGEVPDEVEDNEPWRCYRCPQTPVPRGGCRCEVEDPCKAHDCSVELPICRPVNAFKRGYYCTTRALARKYTYIRRRRSVVDEVAGKMMERADEA